MRLSIPFIILMISLALFQSCNDDELFMAGPTSSLLPNDGAHSRSAFYTSSLVQDENKHWVATKRVPLVGKGRIVDNVAKALVSALSANTKLDHIVDEDLSNCASFGDGLANVAALEGRIVSVRDMHRTYAAGQKVGFMFKVSNSALLTLDVLKSFQVVTYLNGKKLNRLVILQKQEYCNLT